MKTSLLCGLSLTLAATLSGAELNPDQASKVAKAVGYLVGQIHFRQTPLNDELSGIFLKNYLDVLDFNHMIFSQADVDEFQKEYGTKLDDLTTEGDITPAHAIFKRYLKRLEERVALVKKLSDEKYDFTVKERMLPNRNKAAWPKDEAEITQLWRARVKLELLNDRLLKTADKLTAETDKTSREAVRRRYDRQLKTMKEYELSEILETYLSSMSRAYDPHSDYMSPLEAENFDIGSVKMKLNGIGAVLRSDEGVTKIVSLMAGGPAALSKQLQPNDSIVAVQNTGDKEPVEVTDMKLNKVVQMIRGEKDTVVKLTIIPVGATDRKVITITRAEVKLADQMAKGFVVETKDKAGKAERLGVITLPGFYEGCVRDVKTIIERLKKENVAGVVLDLRHNGGGILPESVNMAGLFIPNGPVVQVVTSNGNTRVMRDNDAETPYDGPLIVATSHISASASEIVAAALQDYGRALIVGGKTTHGKGTVQQLIPLNNTLARGLGEDGGRLKFTISTFYRVAGTTTQFDGVFSDIVLPSVFDHLEIGEASLPRALKVKPIPAADFQVQDRVKAHLENLRKASELRLKGSRDFQYINEDVDRVKKQITDKTLSVNEAERRGEQAEQKTRTDARAKERAARPALTEVVYELDLETARTGGPLKKVAVKKPDATTPPDAGNPDVPLPQPEEAMDASMRETLRILSDYARLLPKPKEAASTKSN
ncbi:MAG: tail-specific protease [Pedosphaera sp.]|nr:tail-specific protease [Pedosphaera sp.]